jgi:tetratricopeptide (TPR) repeat protein
LAQFYLAHRKIAEARRVYEAILAETPSTFEGLQAPSVIASLLERQGELPQALEAYQKALEGFDDRLNAYLKRTADEDASVRNAGYLANRAQLAAADTKAAILRKIIDLAEKLNRTDTVSEARKQLVAVLPECDPFEEAIRRAEALLEEVSGFRNPVSGNGYPVSGIRYRVSGSPLGTQPATSAAAAGDGEHSSLGTQASLPAPTAAAGDGELPLGTQPATSAPAGEHSSLGTQASLPAPTAAAGDGESPLGTQPAAPTAAVGTAQTVLESATTHHSPLRAQHSPLTITRQTLVELAVFECLAVLEPPPFVPAAAKGALSENETQLKLAQRFASAQQVAKALELVVKAGQESGGRVQGSGFGVQGSGFGVQGGKESREGNRGETRAAGRKAAICPLMTWIAANVAVRKGEFGKARQMMRALAASSDGNPVQEALARYGLGSLYAREALYPEAVEEFELAAKVLPFRLSALYQKGLAELRQGMYPEAAKTFEAAVAGISDAKFQIADGSSGESRTASGESPNSSGESSKSDPELGGAGGTGPGSGGGVRITDYGLRITHHGLRITALPYRLAQTHEFTGNFGKARELYQRLAETRNADEALRLLSQTALARLERASSRVPDTGSPIPGTDSDGKATGPDADPRAPNTQYPIPHATPLGDNRSDRGRWHLNHGSAGFVLCGMLCPQDIVGGPGQAPAPSGAVSRLPFDYRFTTGKEGENGRRWLSRLEDPGGADLALWNPVTSTWSTANWDDFGEQLPSGTGDLVVSLAIPKGCWRLSLGFLNDHNYYERSRRYAVHVRDGQGRFLTGFEVEDFICPLYKHLAVAGAADLTVHITRDQSLNTVLSGIFLDPFPACCPVPKEVDALLQTLREEWLKDPKPHPERRGDSPATPVGPDLVQYFEDLMARCERVRVGSEARASELRAAGGMVWAKEATATILELERLLEEFHGEIAALPRWMGATASLRLFELESALGRSSERQEAALAYLCNFLRDKDLSGQADFALRYLSRALTEAGRPGAGEVVDRCRAKLALETGWKSVVHRVGPMAAAYYARDRGFAVELFSDYLTALLGKRSRKEQTAILTGLLGQEVREGRWVFAGLLVPRLRRLIPKRDEWPPDLADLVAKTLSGLQRYEAAAMELEGAIRRLESRLPDGVPDKEAEKQLGDRYFLLVCQYAASGNLAKAGEAFERARARLKDADRLANLHHLIGTGYLRLGDQTRARSHFQQIVRSYPDTPWAKAASRHLEQPAETPAPPRTTAPSPKPAIRD